MATTLSLEGFDVAGAVDRMLGQPALWWQVLGLFVEHFSNWTQTWQAAMGDAVQEPRTVHALASAAVNVGAVRLAAAAKALELALLAGSAADGLRGELRLVLQQTMATALAALQAHAPGDRRWE